MLLLSLLCFRVSGVGQYYVPVFEGLLGGELEITIPKVAKEKMPETADAEKWLTDEIFVVKGKLYRILPDYTVELYEDWGGRYGPERTRG